MSATLIDVTQLLDVVATALAAGVGLPVLFAVAVLGASRMSERRGAGAGAGAVVYGALTALCLAACAAGVVLGVVLLTRK